MIKFVTLILISALSSSAFAKIDNAACSRSLYPNSQEDQAFVSKFLEIVEAHKSNDPLLEGRGPSIREYSLDKIKFAFMINETLETIDLAFFNWSLPVFDGMAPHESLSQQYGSTVYILRGLPKKSVANQGDNHDQLTNFSYIFGSRYMEMQLKKDNPDYEVPQQFLDWKPHPDYMDRSHPLRRTLDTHALVLLSPSKELFLQQAGVTDSTRSYFEVMFEQQGGFFNMIMGMMVHEMFHVKEGEDQVNRLAISRPADENRKALVEQLKSDAALRSLMETYVKIVFALGDHLKGNTATQNEIKTLGDLKNVIAELKSKYENAWKFIWNYEYTEGFAEYVSAFSMIQVGVTSLEKQIDLQKGDTNNFAYRTGTLGGLYLALRVKEMPFANNEDHRQSVWEIVLRKTQVQANSESTQSIAAKYSSSTINAEAEINAVIDYLVSTVMDMDN